MQIGIIGAGRIGATVAKLWVEAGHDVRIASRHPDTLRDLVARLGPRASAGSVEDAARFGDIVLLTVPLKAVPELAPTLAPLLAGKIVIDTGNAYSERDGAVANQAAGHANGSAGWAAAMFPDARWVKGLNTVNFRTLEKDAHRDGAQVGVPLAGDDEAALQVAADLVRDAGFDPVPLGPLIRGREFEPGTRVYNTNMTGPELRGVWGGAGDAT